MSDSNALRVVLDTNVLISAVLSRNGSPAMLTRSVVRNGQAVFSDQTFAEFKVSLWKPKFDRYITIEQRGSILRDFEATAFWVDVPSSVFDNQYSRDPKDDMFIHAAQAGNATFLVSGDDDLLSLNPVNGLAILSPRAALELLVTQFKLT